MGGVEGRPYRPENWTDAKRNYIWSTQDYYETEITGEFLQCGFAVNEDGSLTITLYNPSYYLMLFDEVIPYCVPAPGISPAGRGNLFRRKSPGVFG